MEPYGEITRLLLTLSAGDEASAEKLIHRIYDELDRIADCNMRRDRLGYTPQSNPLWKNRARARRNNRVKLRRSLKKPTLHKINVFEETHFGELLAIDETLNRLSGIDPHIVKMVELRFFAGLTVLEISEVLQLSPGVTKCDWKLARTWLARTATAGAA